MDINFNYCSTEEIANLLSLANKDLQQSLINGADWEELKEKRFVVTELAIALHKRQKPEDFGETPAEVAYRKH